MRSRNTVLVYDRTYVDSINFMVKAITVKLINERRQRSLTAGTGGTVVTFINGEGARALSLTGLLLQAEIAAVMVVEFSCGASSPVIYQHHHR